jgi:probable rRNA maturation factor
MQKKDSIAKQFIIASDLPDHITSDFLVKVIRTALECMKWSPDGNISIAFVSKQRSQLINKQFANNDYPTDVLSFDYTMHKIENEFVGEILICSSIAKEQAKKYKVDFESEIALLLVHGLMHLSGLDHQNQNQKASFEILQSGILKSLDLKYHSMSW